MADNQTDDPATIQRDVERTQDAMGSTVQKIEDKLNPRNFAQSLFSGDNTATAQDAWDVVRQSLLPVAMIVGGAAWLFATSEAPVISRARDELRSRLRDAFSSSSRGQQRSSGAGAGGPPPATGEAFDRRPA